MVRVVPCVTLLSLLCSGCVSTASLEEKIAQDGTVHALEVLDARRAVAYHVAGKVRIPEEDPDRDDSKIVIKVGELGAGFAVLGFGCSHVGLFGVLEGSADVQEEAASKHKLEEFVLSTDSSWNEPAAFYVENETIYAVNARGKAWIPNSLPPVQDIAYRAVWDAVILRERFPGFTD